MERVAKSSSVREILTEMKNLSDLMIDLSYASILLQNVELANKVHELETRMDELMFKIRTTAAVVTRNVQEAKKITAILHVASAAELISNSTGDIADLIRKGEKVHRVVYDALMVSDERIDGVKVGEVSSLKDRKLMDLKLASSIGVVILAIKRGDEWLLPVNRETVLRNGDYLVVKGPPDGISVLRGMAGDSTREAKPQTRMAQVRNCLARMRDLSSLTVDLAYSSIFLKSQDLAKEVVEIVNKFDELNRKFWICTLREAKREKNVESLYVLLKIVMSIEQIVSAARSMSDVVLQGFELHPVFEHALLEADEQVGLVDVAEGSPFDGKSLKELNLWTTMGAYVLTVKRRDRLIFDPPRRFRIKSGDSMIVRGPRRGVEAVREAAGGTG
ncbi:MAG: TrkA C-terminal domain-containing protein [Candidatus Hadarchaeales archaeon]